MRPSGYWAFHIMTIGLLLTHLLSLGLGNGPLMTEGWTSEFRGKTGLHSSGLTRLTSSTGRVKGAGGAPIMGLAITVNPAGIGRAIRILLFLSCEGKGPEM